MSEKPVQIFTFIITVVALLACVFAIVCGCIIQNEYTLPLLCAGVIGNVLVVSAALYSYHKARSDYNENLNAVLTLASETMPYMCKGISKKNSQAVCELLLPAVAASSVCITDRNEIKGYAGLAAKDHQQGTPIQTLATKQTLKDGQTRVIRNPEGIAFTGEDAEKRNLKATIVVPLKVQDEILGTLKFFYDSPNKIDKTQRLMVEHFAELLSIELSVAYLEEQKELATRMELKALQTQINPHFLFNTINTIAAYTRKNPDEARGMLREFATYYRRLLENAEDLIPLARELEQTERYLKFQLARFGKDSLKLTYDIAEEFKDMRVPSFILQPLVENAVGHGRKPDETLHIKVSVYKRDDDIIITVADDGVGIPEEKLDNATENESGHGMGIALKNINARLCGNFGPGSGLHIESVYGQGTTVYLNLNDGVLKLDGANCQFGDTIAQ